MFYVGRKLNTYNSCLPVCNSTVYSVVSQSVCPYLLLTRNIAVPNSDIGLPEKYPDSDTNRTLVFTRKWLRYLRVFAVAIPSVVCMSSVCRLSSVTLVHPTQGVEPFGKISSPLCTLAILWPPCKILRRSSQGNNSVGGVKRKRGIKIERFRTYRRLYLTNGTR